MLTPEEKKRLEKEAKKAEAAAKKAEAEAAKRRPPSQMFKVRYTKGIKLHRSFVSVKLIFTEVQYLWRGKRYYISL